MAQPNSKTTFKEYCKRYLGDGVVQINISDAQLDDRVDEAINKWQKEHFNGSIRTFLKYSLTQDDIDNQYITISDSILEVYRILPITYGYSTNKFSTRYQFAIQSIGDLLHTDLTSYYIYNSHIEMINDILGDTTPIDFNPYQNKLFLITNWENLQVGNYIIAEAKIPIVPDTVVAAYKDEWLQQYAIALIKRQWGENLKKFQGMEMPGGVQYNGQQIYDEAIERIKELEDELETKYKLPIQFQWA